MQMLLQNKEEIAQQPISKFTETISQEIHSYQSPASNPPETA
jgi:hypothetical protein